MPPNTCKSDSIFLPKCLFAVHQVASSPNSGQALSFVLRGLKPEEARSTSPPHLHPPLFSEAGAGQPPVCPSGAPQDPSPSRPVLGQQIQQPSPTKLSVFGVPLGFYPQWTSASRSELARENVTLGPSSTATVLAGAHVSHWSVKALLLLPGVPHLSCTLLNFPWLPHHWDSALG